MIKDEASRACKGAIWLSRLSRDPLARTIWAEASHLPLQSLLLAT